MDNNYKNDDNPYSILYHEWHQQLIDFPYSIDIKTNEPLEENENLSIYLYPIKTKQIDPQKIEGKNLIDKYIELYNKDELKTFGYFCSKCIIDEKVKLSNFIKIKECYRYY